MKKTEYVNCRDIFPNEKWNKKDWFILVKFFTQNQNKTKTNAENSTKQKKCKRKSFDLSSILLLVINFLFIFLIGLNKLNKNKTKNPPQICIENKTKKISAMKAKNIKKKKQKHLQEVNT